MVVVVVSVWTVEGEVDVSITAGWMGLLAGTTVTGEDGTLDDDDNAINCSSPFLQRTNASSC